jgi:hypothetical protein
MSSKAKQLERRLRQIELLKNFEGDFYQEKKVGNEWLIKMWNGGTHKWQVAVFSESSFRKYKSFDRATQKQEELDEKFQAEIHFERPTLESVKKMTDGN